MEPITHFLTGACIGRAGLNRKTAYATMAAVLAAEAADLDILWGLAGPVEELKHHRGITHTFIAVPVVAAAAVGTVWVYHRWSEARRRRKAKTAAPIEPGAPERAAPQAVKWGWVYFAAFIAALSHLLLDWTNNYGVRPFFPFNPRWYEGSFVFIAEPVLWALLVSAMVIPALLGLTDREISSRRVPFRGRGWAIFALLGTVLVWGFRWTQHAQAEAMVRSNPTTGAPVKRIAMEPYPGNPFHWHAILETPDFYQTAEINTRDGSIDSDPQNDVIVKPAWTPAIEAAKHTPLGQAYLDWGTWAVVRDLGQEPVEGMSPPQLPRNRTWTTVEFSDLRFAYTFLGTGKQTGRKTLGGSVYIVDGHENAGEAMGGREQH